MKARYYCGNCSQEVSSNASQCPYCGSSFTAVRCPKCSYEGKAAEFRDGCPVCGYMMTQEVRVPVMPAAKKPRPQNLLSRRFYRISGLVLLFLFAVLIVLLLIPHG